MTISNISLHHFAEKLFLPFLKESEITEIAINRPGEIWYEKHGIWQKKDVPDITNASLG